MVIVGPTGPQRSSARRAGFRYASADQGSFRQYPCQAGACRIKILGRAAGVFALCPNIFITSTRPQFLCYGSRRAFARLAMRLPCHPFPCLLSLLSVAWKSSRWTLLHIVCHFLSRLDLPGLFDRHLADLPGRRPDVPSSTILGVLVCNLLLLPRALVRHFLSGLPLLSPNLWVCCQARRTCSTMTVVIQRDRSSVSRSDAHSLFTAIVLRAYQ